MEEVVVDKVAERRARRAAAARARRQDPAVREREAEASRQAARRRRQDPAVRAAESRREAERRQDPAVRVSQAEAARQRIQDPAVRARRAEAARRRRQDPAVREREAAAAQQRREADPQNVRAREAASKRSYRQANPDAVRAREAAAKRIKRARPEAADARFKRDFLDVSFGHSCDVCDRLWFSNNLVTISSIKNDNARATAIAMLQSAFPTAAVSSDLRAAGCALHDENLQSVQANSTVAASVEGARPQSTAGKPPSEGAYEVDNSNPLTEYTAAPTGTANFSTEIGLVQRGSAEAGISAVRCSRPEASSLAVRLWEVLQARRSETAS
ncbi:uncharacterized protein LOC144145872 isoform X1 [Haemaphysalis longicornis]